MAHRSFLVLVMGMVVFFFASNSSADVPDSINYQGKLTTAGGGCLNDTVEMTFTVYSDDQGTSSEWSETQTEVEVKEGIFNVLLGSVNPLSASLFNGSVKYLGVQVESDEEMRPLKPMVSVPYACRAGSADGGGGGGWIDDGTVVRLESSNDSVGIGTTEPTAELHVEGDAYISGILTIGTPILLDGQLERIGISHFGSQEWTPDAKLEIVAEPGTDFLMLSSTEAADGDLVVVKDDGKVGIGTTNPTGKLHVEDADGWAGYFDGTAYFSDFVEVGDGDRLGLLGKVYGHGQGWIPTLQDGPVHGLIGIMHCEEGWVPGYGVLGIVDGAAGTGVKGEGVTGVYGEAKPPPTGPYVNYGVYGKAQEVGPPNFSYGVYSEGDAKVDGGLVVTGEGQFNGTTLIGGVATIETGQRIQGEENGGARILGQQGNTPSMPAIGFFSTDGINDGAGGNGIYRPMANAMAFATSSEERVRIMPGGDIGIGTQNPDYDVHVSKQDDTEICVENPGPAYDKNVGFRIKSHTHAMFPQADWFLYSNFSGDLVIGDYVADTRPVLIAAAAPDSSLSIRPSGVGIGTTNPQGALDVNSTTGALIVPRMSTSERTALAAVNGMIIYNTTTNQFNFYENGAWVTK